MHASQGCTKHLGQDIQEYCNDCEELVCAQCLSNHSFHTRIRFEDYLEQHQKKTKALLQKVKRIRDRTLNLKVVLEKAKEDWDRNRSKILDAIESFKAVDEGITRWKDNLISYVEQRKSDEISKCEASCNEVLQNTFYCNTHATSFSVPRIKIDVQSKCSIRKKLRNELFPVGIQKCLDDSLAVRRRSWHRNMSEDDEYLHSTTDWGNPSNNASSTSDNTSPSNNASSTSDNTSPTVEASEAEGTYDDVCNEIYEKIPDYLVPRTHSLSMPACAPSLSPKHPEVCPTVVKPINSIIGTWFAEKPNENVVFEQICTTPSGSIVINDPRNSCIRIYTKAGKKCKKQFKERKVPMVIAYSNSHSAIITAVRTTSEPSKWYLNRTKYACDGKIGADREFKLPCVSSSILGITSAPCGRTQDGTCCIVTISEEGHGSIFFLNCKGEFIAKLQSEYTGQQPSAIAYHNDYIVVCDGKGQLAKLTCQGSPLWSSDKAARTPNILNQPKGIALLPDQRIAVCDAGNHCIAIFSKDGDLLSRFGGHGSELGMFKFPQGIAVGFMNDLVVNDFGNNRIQTFTFRSISATPRPPEPIYHEPAETYECIDNMAYIDLQNM